MKHRWPYILLSILTLVILLPGFYADQWNAGNKEASRKKVTLGESSVMGRLALTREQGFTAGGGFLAFVFAPGDTNYTQAYQYEAYVHDQPFENYHLYLSTSGFQGFLYGLFDVLTPFSPAFNMAFFKFINALLLVLAFTLFINIFFHYFGWPAALMTLAGLAASFILPYYGPDPYFTFWSYYFPVLAVFLYLAREERAGSFNTRRGFFLVFTAMLIKCLLNGFEFITAVFVMAIIPVVFYSIKGHWGWKRILSSTVLFSGAMMAAIVINLVLLSIQISVYEKAFSAGPDYLLKSLHKRTSGDAKGYDFDELVRKSLKADLDEVLQRQFKGKAMDLNHITGRRYLSLLKITFLELTAWVAFISILLLWMIRWGRWRPEEKDRTLALVVSTLASLAAPFSWYIIFKGHAYIHTRLDLVAWYLPYFLFSMALTGHFLSVLTGGLKQRLTIRRKS
jgi:hypothetical protein